MKKKSPLSWTWILFLLFLGLSVYDRRFGVLGYLCMLSPLVLALVGKKKRHCSRYCPRASFLKSFMGKLSLKHTLPGPLRTKTFRWILLGAMMGLFAFSLFRAWGDMGQMGGVMFRMIGVSSAVSMIMGFFYNERSWCSVCPMGFSAQLMGTGILPTKGEDRVMPVRKKAS